MRIATKIMQPDLFIKEPHEVEKIVIEAKKKNYTRRINYMFGELDRIKSELQELGLYEEEKTP